MSENNFKFLEWVKMSANSITGKMKMPENDFSKIKNVGKWIEKV